MATSSRGGQAGIGGTDWLEKARAQLRRADPVLARVIAAGPDFDRVNAVAPQLIDTASNRASLPADVIAHAVAPQAIAGVIAVLVSGVAAPVSGAILPVYGA